MKASRYITHVKRLTECRDPVRTLFERARGLGRKLGPVLFQLPPNMKADPDRLRGFCRLLSPKRAGVFEFRHESWFAESVYAVLRDRGVALCVPVGGPVGSVDLVVTAPLVYVRMHAGRGRDGNFTPTQLREWAGHLRTVVDRGLDVYVYFNNDWQGFAIRNALELRQLLGVGC